MGAAQSQEEPDVVRIDRDEIPEEYKTVGVSSDVVRRVNSRTNSPETERLKAELTREREERQRLREEMARLSELQQRNNGEKATSAHSGPDDYEERKRIFEETVQRVEEKFFPYHRENACSNHEEEIMACLKENPNRILKCASLAKAYEKCVADFRQEVLEGK